MKSLAQQRYMQTAALPSHVKQMAHGGYACMACGGMVGAHGYAFGGEANMEEPHRSDDEFTNAIDEANEPGEDDIVLPDDADEDDEDTHKAKFAKAIMGRGRK